MYNLTFSAQDEQDKQETDRKKSLAPWMNECCQTLDIAPPAPSHNFWIRSSRRNRLDLTNSKGCTQRRKESVARPRVFGWQRRHTERSRHH